MFPITTACHDTADTADTANQSGKTPGIVSGKNTDKGASKDAHKETGNKIGNDSGNNIGKDGNAARLLPLTHPAETVTRSPEKIRPRGIYLIPIAAAANIPAINPARFSARFSATCPASDRHSVYLTSVRGGGLCGSPQAAFRRGFNLPLPSSGNIGSHSGKPTGNLTATTPHPCNCRPHQGMLQCQRHNTCVRYRHPINRD
ncbi:MAG: hypothetical protein ACXVCO_08420 [Ktedonobacterales bacterium]